MKVRTGLLLIVLVMCCVCTGVAQNLLQNPGFEQTGGSGEWSSNPADWWNYGTAANQESWAAQPNVGGGYGCAFQGWIDGGWAGIGQSVYVDMTNGNVFKFTVNLKCEEDFTSSGQELWLELRFKAGGVEVADERKSIYEQAKEPNGREWNTYSFIYTNTYDNVTIVDAVIGGGQFAAQGGDLQAVLFDNASLTQHKAEPSTTVTMFEDNFEGGTLAKWEQKTAGDWVNSTNEPINGTRSLKNNNEDSVETYISAATSYNVNDSETTWRFTLKDDWGYDPSATGYSYVWLMADSSNLGEDGAALANGYVVGMDYDNDDMIKLWRYTGGAMDQLLVASTVEWTKRSTNAIQVTRSKTGTWSLSISPGNTFDNLVSYGTAMDTTYTASDRFGLYALLSSSRAGKLWMDDVQIFQKVADAASVTITNPAQAYLEVPGTTGSYPISGLAQNAEGDMVYWRNAVTLDAGSAAVADGKWSCPAVNLNAGMTNVITVVASNAAVQRSVIGSDDASNYGGDWENGENQGSGFDPWELENYGGGPGYIIASSKSIGPGTGIDVDTDDVAFGMYSFSGNWAGAYRFFADGPLTSGQVFSVDMAMNYLAGGRGFDLCAANKATLINFHCSNDGQFKISDESSSLTWPNNGQGFRYSLSVEQVSDSDCRITISRSDGNEWTDTRSFSSPVAGIKFYAGGMNASVTNTYQYLYVNNLELSCSQEDRTQVAIYRISGKFPVITITNPPGNITVDPDVVSYALSGVASNLVGTMSWTNSATGMNGTMAAGSIWSATVTDLAIGRNSITVYGRNTSNETTSAAVDITRLQPPPLVVITSPASNLVVGNLVTNMALSGTVTQADEVEWINVFNSENGTVTNESGEWSQSGLGLSAGTNVFFVECMNTRGYVTNAQDDASLYTVWTNGSNKGVNLNAWSLNTSGDVQYGLGTDGFGNTAWSMKAWNGSCSLATRSLMSTIQAGEELQFDLSFPAKYDSAGVSLQNSDGTDLLAVRAEGDKLYVRHNGASDELLPVPFSTNGMRFWIVFNTATSYVARVGVDGTNDMAIYGFKGDLINPAVGESCVSQLQFFNYNTFVTEPAVPMYLNNIKRCGYISRDYVSVVRESDDIPDIEMVYPAETLVVGKAVGSVIAIGRCNASVEGDIRWYNELSGENGSFPGALSWTNTFALSHGTNQITLTVTNSSGVERSASFTVQREPAGIAANYPAISVATPVAGIEVSASVERTAVSGYSTNVVGGVICWALEVPTNRITMIDGVGAWTGVVQVALPGTNQYVLYGDNDNIITWGTDNADALGYAGGWFDGTGSNTTMSAWSIDLTGNASALKTNIAVLGSAWALQSDTGAVASASRTFDRSLLAGDLLKTFVAHSALSNSGKAGFSLVNSMGLRMMDVYAEAGSSNYIISDALGVRTVSSCVSTQKLPLMLSPVGTNGEYLLWIGTTNSTFSSSSNTFFGKMQSPLFGSKDAEGIEFWHSGEDGYMAMSSLSVDGGQTFAYTYVFRNGSGTRPVWINEVHYINEGSIVGAGVEVAGLASESLGDYSLVQYHSSGSPARPLVEMWLSGFVIDDESDGYGAVWIPYFVTNNTPYNGFALMYRGDTFTQVVNYVTWGGSCVATSGPATGMISDNIGEEHEDTPVGYSLQLTGTGKAYDAFTWSGPTFNSPGMLNCGQFMSTSTNGTGIPDSWWYQYFAGNPGQSGAMDPDADGFSNYVEFMGDTDPTDPSSYSAIGSIEGAGNNQLTIGFATSDSRNYRIYQATNLYAPVIWNQIWYGHSEEGHVDVTVTGDVGQAFYKMGAEVPGWSD